MKKPCVLALLLLAVLNQLRAEEIAGKVISTEGNPVVEAVIYHSLSGKKAVSDYDGKFSLSIPDSERIGLEIIHPEYFTKFVTFSSRQLGQEIVIELTPYIRQKEEIVVTALRYPEASTKVPAAETVVPTEILDENMAANLAEGISELPGVSNIGSGGFSLVPNIRGLARRRVLIMIDNARVTSDRRTGPNASFVNSKDISRIEVLRSPSSVFYGSDAIGGVIHILTKSASGQEGLGGSVFSKYGTVNQEKNIGFSLQGRKGDNGFYLSFQAMDAENYSSPSGEILQSEFAQGSLFGKLSHVDDSREIHMSFLGARGYDIGKANQDSASKPTWYPLETQNLLQLRWREKNIGKEGELNAQVFINPNLLETIKETIKDYRTGESYSKTQSVDYGLHLSYGRELGNFRFVGGVDLYGRAGAQAETRDTSFDAAGRVTDNLEQIPYDSGSRRDLGVFLSCDYYGFKGLDLVGGVRLDRIRLRAVPGGDLPPAVSEHTAMTGFVGASASIYEGISAFANLSRAYRAPGLGELFYTGVSGRGFILAQPTLTPENSFNVDFGLKIMKKRFFAGIYAFYYRIDDMIERYMPEAAIFTYGNIDAGQIVGYEIETEFYLVPGWKLFGNFFSFSGHSLKSEDTLNDIPPPRLYLGTKLWVRKLTVELNLTLQRRKESPGPAEITLPGHEVANLKASYQLLAAVRLYAVLSNIFNQEFIARPDPDAVSAPGRNFVMGVDYAF